MCSSDGSLKKCVQNFGGDHLRKKSLKGPREIWKDNIKIVLMETDCEWTEVAEVHQDYVYC
jgi:hypothetical protein